MCCAAFQLRASSSSTAVNYVFKKHFHSLVLQLTICLRIISQNLVLPVVKKTVTLGSFCDYSGSKVM